MPEAFQRNSTTVCKKKRVSESVRLVDFTADQSVPYVLIFLRNFMEELQITGVQ